MQWLAKENEVSAERLVNCCPACEYLCFIGSIWYKKSKSYIKGLHRYFVLFSMNPWTLCVQSSFNTTKKLQMKWPKKPKQNKTKQLHDINRCNIADNLWNLLKKKKSGFVFQTCDKKRSGKAFFCVLPAEAINLVQILKTLVAVGDCMVYILHTIIFWLARDVWSNNSIPKWWES